ncbi:MAG: Ig-like domain-containing protein, partial [Coprobacillus sp.]|nr:Ig-like domain-containing protein [Coprobacillus sp.]
IDISSDNVNIEIKDEEGNPSSVLTNDGLTLIPIGEGEATVYISWVSGQDILATTSFEVTILEPIAPVYKLEILNKTDLQQTWYLGDEARELKISITPDSETAEEQNVTSLINNNEIQVNVNPSDALGVSISSGSIYLSPLKAYDSITVSVSWLGHEEAFSSVTLALGEHTYSISITNSDALSSPWSIEEGTRELEYNLYQDGSLLEVETGYIELKSSDETLASVEGFNITPKGAGEPIIYILWYEEDEKTTLLAYDLVTLSIDSVVKPVSISLSLETIAFTNAYTDSETLTAVVYGKNNQEATNQNVTWSADTGIVITGEGNTISISVTGYNVSGKITCISQADGDVKAECTVSIGEEPSAPAPNVETDTKYKLGCIDASGNYVFFDGNVASSHLESTRYWDEAANVYITANPYDGIENSCTLATLDGNTIKYITNTGSSANVTLSTSPCVWVWNEENELFAVGSSSGYGLFCYTDDSFRGYAQSSSNLNYPHIVAYAEKPQDYTEPEKIEIPEPNIGSDPTYKLGALVSGTYKYFDGTTTGTTSLNPTDNWASAADVYITGATGDNPDGACTLSFVNSSGSLQYIQNGGDSSIKLDSSPSTWYYEVQSDGSGAFVQSTTNGRFIGFAQDGASIRAYAHTNLSGGSYPVVVPYSENPLEASPSTITISAPGNQVIVGGTLQLSAEIGPTGASGNVIWSSSNDTYASVDQTGLVIGNAVCESVTITASVEGYEGVSDTITLSVIENPATEDNPYPYSYSYSHTFTTSSGLSTSASTTQTYSGLTWTVSSSPYWGSDSSSPSRGLQIGSSGSAATSGVTFTVDFGEIVELTSFSITCCSASGGSGTVTIALDSSTVNTISTTTTSTEYSETSLSIEGQTLVITFKASSKAMYFHSMSFSLNSANPSLF